MISILLLIFITGYFLIIFGEKFFSDKAAFALITSSLLWITIAIFDNHLLHELSEHLSETSEIVFFLMGAMTIVELIDLNNGFDIVYNSIRINNKKILIFLLSLITFFFSAILDNLTTAIIMSMISSKFFEGRDRQYAAALIIIFANAGGVWSPIGDVTTTMLWISEKVTTPSLMKTLIIPSLLNSFIPLLFIIPKFKGKLNFNNESKITSKKSILVLILGLSAFISIPILKIIIGIPPYIGILFGLGALWIIVELINKIKPINNFEDKNIYRALENIDIPSLLFFLGILLSIAALQSAGILKMLTLFLDENVKDFYHLSFIIGIVSSIFDNVPIVAAILAMYEKSQFVIDSPFWLSMAYSSGTGGSLLVIGSAAGVAIMKSENLTFIWYLKNITLYSFLGFLIGFLVFVFL